MEVISISLAVGMSRTSTPPMVIDPWPTSQKRAARRVTVDLPLPDGPISAVISPSAAVSDRPENTG